MNKCKLCQINDATKTNTHYLTDAIIRSALNEGGSNIREKGYYFDMSTDRAGIDFNFQRKTSIEKIESDLRRDLTEDEIKKAKSETPFSVDYIFCPTCENIFSEIENPFIENILPLFRSGKLDKTEFILINDVKQIRLFFLLQIIRTNLSVNNFHLSQHVIEQLRTIILYHKGIDFSEINIFPLAIAYLKNEGELIEKTSNLVGYDVKVSPNVIFLNDFIIQFFESKKLIENLKKPFNENDKTDHKYINFEENENFIVKLFNNDQRLKFLLAINQPKMEATIQEIRMNFSNYFFLLFGIKPADNIVDQLVRFIIDSDMSLIEKYSENGIKSRMATFIHNLINNSKIT